MRSDELDNFIKTTPYATTFNVCSSLHDKIVNDIKSEIHGIFVQQKVAGHNIPDSLYYQLMDINSLNPIN